MRLSPLGIFPFFRASHDLICHTREICTQEAVKGQFVNVAFHALIQKALKGFVKLMSLRRSYELIFVRLMMTIFVTLTGQSIRITNAIRVTLFNCIYIHGIECFSKFCGIISDYILQLLGRQRVVSIPSAHVFSMVQSCYDPIDSITITNKSRHFIFSFSKVRAPTRLRFLSRETGVPNKSLHVKRKIPFALDSVNYTHYPVGVKI